MFHEATQQFNGREIKTATLLSSHVITFGEFVGGYAPCRLKHQVLCFKIPNSFWILENDGRFKRFYDNWKHRNSEGNSNPRVNQRLGEWQPAKETMKFVQSRLRCLDIRCLSPVTIRKSPSGFKRQKGGNAGKTDEGDFRDALEGREISLKIETETEFPWSDFFQLFICGACKSPGLTEILFFPAAWNKFP